MRPLARSEKELLLYIASRDKVDCKKGKQSVSDICGYAKSTIQSALSTLHKRDLVDVRPKATNPKSNYWSVTETGKHKAEQLVSKSFQATVDVDITPIQQ